MLACPGLPRRGLCCPEVFATLCTTVEQQDPFSAYPHCPHGWLCTAGGSARDSSCCAYLRLDLHLQHSWRLWHPI